jgi:hypothetical protein
MNERNDIRWAQNPPSALNNRFVIDSLILGVYSYLEDQKK